jgi:hypothetical protein
MSHLSRPPIIYFHFNFYTGGKLITGVVDTGGKFTIGINDTGCKVNIRDRQ